MALRVNTNVEAINVHNNLLASNKKVADSLARLSSGKRINSAKDDASGLAVANNFRAKISSMRVASQNATEANSMLQVADGAYSKITDILVRMRDLATQAASDQTEQRDKLDTEFTALRAEIDRIAGSTKYGNMTVTNGTQSYTFQVGAGSGGGDNVLALSFTAVSTGALGIGTSAISNASAASSAMAAIDTALSSMNSYMANVGAYQNRLQYTIENLAISIENFSASESAIRDADMAYEMTMFTKNQILQQTGIAMLSQANQAPQQIMQLIGG
ncbi:MAG: flagellin [Syntrophobacteraceae bacterium]